MVVPFPNICPFLGPQIVRKSLKILGCRLISYQMVDRVKFSHLGDRAVRILTEEEGTDQVFSTYLPCWHL